MAAINSGVIPYGQKLQVAGWGLIKRKGVYKKPKYLQKTKVRISSNQTCSQKFRGNKPGSILCAIGTAKDNKDSCQGDSGGPLFKTFLKKQAIIYGVVSFGVGECGDGQPAVYTDVKYHSKWIKETIKNVTLDYQKMTNNENSSEVTTNSLTTDDVTAITSTTNAVAQGWAWDNFHDPFPILLDGMGYNAYFCLFVFSHPIPRIIKNCLKSHECPTFLLFFK